MIDFPQTIDAPPSGFSGWTCAEIVAVIVFVVVVRLFLPGIRGGVEIDFKRAVEPVEVRTDIADGLPEFGEKEILSVPDFDPEPEVFPAPCESENRRYVGCDLIRLFMRLGKSVRNRDRRDFFPIRHSFRARNKEIVHIPFRLDFDVLTDERVIPIP